MTLLRRLAGFAALLAATLPASAASAEDFDFYVLSLSWSPTYCLTDDDPSEAQCDVRRGFVVHGLWPQYERGWPEYCDSSASRWLDQRIIDLNDDIFPDKGLAIHQWRKHGMCSGLSQEDYFDLIREAADNVAVPPELTAGSKRKKADPALVERLFARDNDGLAANGMAVLCEEGMLAEVRVCLTKDLEFRACREVDADHCRAKSVIVPSVR